MSILLKTTAKQLPKNWRFIPLGDILTEVINRYEDLKKADELPVLSLTKNHGLILQSDRFNKRVATEDVSRYKVVNHGEIVYNPYVIWEGAVHSLKKYKQGLVSPVYVVWKCDDDQADKYIVDVLLRTPLVIEQYNLFSAGAVNRRRAIKKEDFLKIKIPLPPLSEQQDITQVLKTLQNSIEQQTRLISLTHELKSKLLLNLFTTGLCGEKQKKTEIGMMPVSWAVAKLATIVEDTKQINLRTDGNRSIKYIDVSSISREHLSVEQTTEYLLKYAPGRARKKVMTGDVIFATVRPTLLRVAHIGKELNEQVCSTAFCVLRAKHNISDKYIYYVVQREQYIKQLAAIESGASYPAVTDRQVKSQKVPVPGYEEQLMIANILDSCDIKVFHLARKKEKLEELFRALLHQLMTGQIRIK